MPVTSSTTLLHTTLALTVLAVASCAAGHQPATSTPATESLAPIAPTELRWHSWRGIDLPYARQGPRNTDTAAVSGFDQSPAGAALAAIHASVRMAIAPDNQWPQVGQTMLAPGPGRDAWAGARAQVSIAEPAGPEGPTILGYTVTTFLGADAAIEIYSSYRDGSLTCHHANVVWLDNDWRLRLSLPGQPVVAVESTPAAMLTLARR
ncbi:hypothetical protein ACFWUP_23750 [Nocardia sp. NPDC058658]|uniref:hypothetical protein n=1 Tax=Nocardia sp. NPDC058658 TaxID=3346580 RepID=UPI0036608348